MSKRRSSEFEGLDPYLKTLPRSAPLTREEERELAIRCKEGDPRAREELITRNLPFVVAVAKRYLGRGARLDDLVQEGNLGLLRAVEKFDTKKGTRFSTYSVWWIRAYIQKYLREVHSAVRGGEDGHRAWLRDVSLDMPVDEEGDLTGLDRLEDEGPTPEETVIRSSIDSRLRERLERYRKRIGPLGWDILEERLGADEPQTLEAIGKRWGLSRERVRQVELQPKRFLQRALEDFYEAA